MKPTAAECKAQGLETWLLPPATREEVVMTNGEKHLAVSLTISSLASRIGALHKLPICLECLSTCLRLRPP